MAGRFRALRFSRRFGLLLWTALQGIADYALSSAGQSRQSRSEWLHYWCGRGLDRLEIDVQLIGAMPPSGLIVCNHLSYLDILVLSATAPCVFVSKHEVRSWPIFGWMATMAGTVYVNREKASDATRVNVEMAEALGHSLRVVLFPEGTSSDGSTVLPFRSPLLQAAVAAEQPVTAAHIAYELEDGDPGLDVCYWGDMTFFPHLVRLLSRGKLDAQVRISPHSRTFHDRKVAALELRNEVLRLAETDLPAPMLPSQK